MPRLRKHFLNALILRQDVIHADKGLELRVPLGLEKLRCTPLPPHFLYLEKEKLSFKSSCSLESIATSVFLWSSQVGC